MPLAIAAHMVFFSGVAELASSDILSRCLLSCFLVSSVSWGLYWMCSLTPTALHIILPGVLSEYTCSTVYCEGFQTFLWNLGGSLLDPTILELHSLMILKSVLVPAKASPLELDWSGVWMLFTKPGPMSLGQPTPFGILPRWSEAKNSVLKWNVYTYIFESCMAGVLQISEVPRRHLSYWSRNDSAFAIRNGNQSLILFRQALCSWATSSISWLLFDDTNLFRNYSFFGPNYTHASLLA